LYFSLFGAVFSGRVPRRWADSLRWQAAQQNFAFARRGWKVRSQKAQGFAASVVRFRCRFLLLSRH
jgi:hypothetical protein